LRALYEWLQVNPPDPQIFISVFNPEDHRKNINAMLRGFYNYQRRNPNAILLIKLVTSLKRHNLRPQEMMYKLIANKLTDNGVLQSPAILFIFDYMSDEQMSALYSAADFYLCTSIAEGQNLPLLEAMAHGAIAVSPRHTAMLDYLDDDNSVAMASRRINNFLRYVAPANFKKPFEIDFSDEHDVFDALESAGRLSEAQRRAMSENAIATVERLYGVETVLKTITGRFEAIDARANGAVA
jgi:glycosyltransferase involved in cell wall biosynthesis